MISILKRGRYRVVRVIFSSQCMMLDSIRETPEIQMEIIGKKMMYSF